MRNTISAIAIACVLSVGCTKETQVSQAASKSDAVVELLRKCSAGEGVLFTSWNGARRGVDSDFRITLKGDMTLLFEEDGFTPEKYGGTFTLGPDGAVVVTIPSYRQPWPAMVLKSEDGVLKLYRLDGVTSFGPGVDGADGFWPFVASH